MDSRGIEYIKDMLYGARETLTHAVKQISTDHAYIHEGLLFCYPVKVAIAAGQTYKVTFKTPAVTTSGIRVHYRPAFISSSGDKVTVTTYESASGNSGGSAVTPINRNRASTKTATVVVTVGQTVTSNGVIVDMQYIGGGTGVGGTESGAVASAEDEIYMGSDNLYNIVILNESADSNTVMVMLHWYEENE